MGWLWLASCVACVLFGWLLRGPPRWFVLWHQQATRNRWRRISGGGRHSSHGGRPRKAGEVISRIIQMSLDNPTWGAPRIHGELKKLGFDIAQSTVSKYIPRRRPKPTPGWKLFLDENAADIVAIDMLQVTTLMFQRLYALVVLGHDRRRILHIEVTDHPSAPWLARQITEAFPWDEAPVCLIRDNDGAYGLTFRRRVRAMGIRDKPTMPYSPWQNPYVERVIGSIKRDCLNYVVILDAPHLRRVLREYVEYYNNDRTHLGLGKDTPNFRPVEVAGKIAARPILGGLHHRYSRVPIK